MDNYIYLGGAVGHALNKGVGNGYKQDNWMMPVLIKLDSTFKYVWGYRMDYRDDTATHYPTHHSGDIAKKYGRSLDILFADH